MGHDGHHDLWTLLQSHPCSALWLTFAAVLELIMFVKG